MIFKKTSVPRIVPLSKLIRLRTENYFTAHKLCCSESIIFVINQGLGGGLTPEIATRIGSGFCGGMGGGNGICGALSGAVAAMGLMLGPSLKDGIPKKKLREETSKLHHRFQDEYGSTCCNTLTEPYKHNRKTRKTHCKEITGYCAELVAERIIALRPKLADTADTSFLSKTDSVTGAFLTKFTPST